MSEPVNPPKEMRRVSASRLKELESCTYLFYANEFLKIPQREWPATTAGSLVHSVLECLYRDHYRADPDEACEPGVRVSHRYHDRIKAVGTIYAVPAVERLVRMWQEKTGMDDKIASDIDPMAMLVINQTDFLDSRAIRRFEPEHEFKLKLPSGGILKGYIDRMCENPEGFVLHDYKSQKRRFDDDAVRDSYQSLCYQLYIWKTFGKLAEVRYYMLRHPPTSKLPQKHIQTTWPATPSQLEGFEMYLDHMHRVINGFTVKDACSGFNGDFGFCRNVCSYFAPSDYYSVKKKGTNVLVSNHRLDKPPQPAEDEYVETLHFAGCPKHNRS